MQPELWSPLLLCLLLRDWGSVFVDEPSRASRYVMMYSWAYLPIEEETKPDQIKLREQYHEDVILEEEMCVNSVCTHCANLIAVLIAVIILRTDCFITGLV